MWEGSARYLFDILDLILTSQNSPLSLQGKTRLNIVQKEIDFFEKKESISKSSFVTKTTAIFEKLSEFLLKESLAKVSFAYHLRTNKFPHWLVSDSNIFLGKYQVHKIISLSQHYASLDIEEAETEVR